MMNISKLSYQILLKWLLKKEDYIASGIGDYGSLEFVFKELFGRSPMKETRQ